MKRITVRKKLACYLVAVIMAVTGASTMSYAATDSGDPDPENTQEQTVQDEGITDDDALTDDDVIVDEDADLEEDADLDQDEDVDTDADVDEENADEEGELSTMDTSGSITGIKASYNSSTKVATVNWTQYTDAALTRYEVSFGVTGGTAETVTIDDPSATSATFTLSSVKNKCYTATVKAYSEDLTDPENPVYTEIATGSKGKIYIYATKKAPTNVKYTVQTMTKAYDSQSAKLNIKKQKKNGYKNKIVIVEPDVKITFKAATGATSYKIYKYTATSKGKIKTSTKKKIKTISASGTKSYSYKEKVSDSKYKKKNYGWYWFKVAAVYPDGTEKVASAIRVNKNVVSGKTSTTKYYRLTMPKFLNVSGVSITGQKTGRSSIVTYKFYCKTNTSAKFYKQGSGSSYKRWIPKGTKGWTNGGSGSKFQVHDTKYGTGYVMRHKMTCYKLDYSPYVDWTKSRKEKYVNTGTKKFKGGGKYVIWVSRYTQTINIFKKNSSGKYKLVRECECATGQFRHYTASGVFKINKRIQHRVRSKYHYYYLNCYNGINSMHGPTYWKSNSKPKSLPSAHMGKNAMGSGTLGCVRTWNEDAYWIWNNCSMKTKTVVY